MNGDDLMELLQLYYFKVLAEREHLTRTAESLMIAAPSLSATISRLENELGVKLFDRVGRNIRLNENGRILQRYVNEIFDALQNAKTELKDAGVRRDNCFTVASTAESLWTRAIHKFLETYPDILVRHTAIKLDDLNQHMTSSKYDFIVTALRDLDCGEWDYEVLYHDWPVLVFNSSHRFHGRKTLDLLEAKNEPFVALSQGYSSRRWFDEICAASGFKPNVVVECDYQLRTEMLRANYGIGFSSVLGIASNILSTFEYAKLSQPLVPRTQVIAWHKGRKLSVAAHQFRSFLIKYMEQYQNTEG